MAHCCTACYVTAKAAKVGCMTFCALLAVAFFGLTITGLVIIFTNPDCGYTQEDEPEEGASYVGCAYLFMFLINFIVMPIF